MRFRIPVKLFFLILIAVNCLLAQTDNFVAKVDNDVITVKEFVTRFELMPLVSKNRNIDSLKHEFLYTLISEKLLAEEAEALGFGGKKQFRDIYEPLEKMYVRDALFKKEIESKVRLTPEEITKGLNRINFRLKVNIISSTDSSEIFNIYRELKKGASFDSLLSLTPDGRNQKEPFTISYGDMEEEHIEDILFSLKPGTFSEPVKTKHGWFIFFLKDKIYSTENESALTPESRVKKILKEKKTRGIGTAYMNELLQGIKITPDASLFNAITENISNVLQNKISTDTASIGKQSMLGENDIELIKTRLGEDTLAMALVPFKEHPATVNDFLSRYYHYGFKVSSIDNQTIASRLRNDLHSFIEHELLTREGYRQGLDKLPEVQNDLKMWKENFLARMYKNSLAESVDVTDDEVLNYYNEKYKTDEQLTLCKIDEIVSDDLSVLEYVLNELEAGKDFEELSDELSGQNKKDEEYFTSNEKEEIGKIVSGMKVGDVYGPIKTAEGYSLFKLIDKKESKKEMPQTYAEIKNSLKEALRFKKIYRVLEDKVVELSDEHPVLINEKVLSQIEPTGINMFTYRYFGFGGRIAAVPYSFPFHEWIKKSEHVKTELP